jgi:hypothetical protein
MAQDRAPLSEKSAAIYFEAVIAAILASAAVGVAQPTPDNLIALYKQMLQKLRSTGDSFN